MNVRGIVVGLVAGAAVVAFWTGNGTLALMLVAVLALMAVGILMTNIERGDRRD